MKPTVTPHLQAKITFYCSWAHALNKEKEGEVLPSLDSEKQPTNQTMSTLEEIEAHELAAEMQAERAAARMQDMDKSGSWAFSCLMLLFLFSNRNHQFSFCLPTERRQGGRWIIQ